MSKCAKINPNHLELWMGTHPSGPSLVAENQEPLSTFLEANPEALGDKVRQKFGNKLPFLFKVTSTFYVKFYVALFLFEINNLEKIVFKFFQWKRYFWKHNFNVQYYDKVPKISWVGWEHGQVCFKMKEGR